MLGVAWLALLAPVAPGCLYDADKPCGENQEMSSDGARCVCVAGTVYTPTGCVTCGAHEVPSASGCVCEDGYSKPTSDAACMETPAGLGAACDPAASTCTAPYDHCEAASDGGYCTTTGCTTSDECEGGYACNAASTCQRPPVGLGKACESDADCAGTEATYCDLFVAHSCQVQGCTLDPNNCFAGFECCDLSAFGVAQPLCIPEGACVKP